MDDIDVQSLSSDHFGDGRQLLSGDSAGEQGQDVARFPLLADPVVVVAIANRLQSHPQAELFGSPRDFLVQLHPVGRQPDHDAEQQRLMDHRLVDIQDLRPLEREGVGQRSSQTGPVFAGKPQEKRLAGFGHPSVFGNKE